PARPAGGRRGGSPRRRRRRDRGRRPSSAPSPRRSGSPSRRRWPVLRSPKSPLARLPETAAPLPAPGFDPAAVAVAALQAADAGPADHVAVAPGDGALLERVEDGHGAEVDLRPEAPEQFAFLPRRPEPAAAAPQSLAAGAQLAEPGAEEAGRQALGAFPAHRRQPGFESGGR